MKVLLVCAGGLSTSILMKKMSRWASENNRDLKIHAIAKSALDQHWQDYDVILTGPQISYSVEEIKGQVSIPVSSIPPLDYAIGNAENVMKLADELIKTKEN